MPATCTCIIQWFDAAFSDLFESYVHVDSSLKTDRLYFTWPLVSTPLRCTLQTKIDISYARVQTNEFLTNVCIKYYISNELS